jgi:hypothetical protein
MNFFIPASEDLDNSLPLEPMRLSQIGEQQLALKDLLSELVSTHPTKLKPEEKHKLRGVYRQILLNVIYNSIRGVYTGIPRGKEAFDPGSYWRRCGLSYRFTIAALDRLYEGGYITQFKGFFNGPAGFGRLTRIYGTEKLSTRVDAPAIGDHMQFTQDDETLVLKGFDYEATTLSADHPDVSQLRIINEFLKDFSWPQKAPIRLIYSGGPLLGGRVYTRFQNMPKAVRAELTINGEQTVELDFKANHLMMLVALSGLKPPEDPYLTIAYLAGQSREKVKAFINTSLSAANATQAFNACKKDRINKALFLELEAATKTAFPDVPLYQGFGVYLQSLEGQVALNIMAEGARNGIPVLPVHDSFITTKNNELWLRDMMIKQWKQQVDTAYETRVEKK